MATSGEEGSHGASDSIVTEFATYEDFLDSQITPTDLYYLEVSCFEACKFPRSESNQKILWLTINHGAKSS